MKGLSNKNNYAIIRQPIFDSNKTVIAYNVEIKRFNKSMDMYGEDFNDIDKKVLESINKISEGKKIFVHFGIDSILKELPLFLQKERFGIDIYTSMDDNPEIIKKLEMIKLKGIDLIVDGFNLHNAENPLLDFADIFTVDFRLEEIKNKNSIFESDEKKKIKLLARDVETETDFELALKKGFDYFQGNFFIRPDIIPAENIPSFKLNLIKLLEELNKPAMDFSKIEETLKRDVALTYKLFRYMNSASTGIKSTINSISHALNLLGEIEVKKWLSVMVVSSVSSDKPEELLKQSLIRAKFCELIAKELGMKDEENDYFLTGMFSLMDAFIGRPLNELISELPLKKEIKSALTGGDNNLKKVLELVTDYETGRWKDVKQEILQAELKQEKIIDFYRLSVEWSGFLKK